MLDRRDMSDVSVRLLIHKTVESLMGALILLCWRGIGLRETSCNVMRFTLEPRCEASLSAVR